MANMPRPRKTRKQRVQVAHLKYAAVTTKTLNNYRKAVFAFFSGGLKLKAQPDLVRMLN